MVKWWNKTAWIYINEQGAVYMLRIVDEDRVTEIPVSNSTVALVRNVAKEIFGVRRNKIYVVETVPEGS